ncbi:MAG: prepilin-type N-terminal cleavage/methylation domain-containing protein [Candidatus Muirbacterium halophilum]|nr:prepilin-type N-terminal cleavage/methylation domain-containing protein [Candidatus Muirbacterium halophilum]MCK9474943.1 prepilin-type N-terminal cleavage/methylation domain-containing protein [Candidatus Muirbacterium halophilum]
MKNKGFTLTELMITLVILVVAGGTVLSMFIFSSKGTNAEADYFKAIFLTQSLAEEYLEAVYQNPKDILPEKGRFSEPDDNYYYEVEYSPVKGEQLLYNVKITTKWDKGLKTFKYPLNLMISKKYFLDVEEKIHTAFDKEYGPVGY